MSSKIESTMTEILVELNVNEIVMYDDLNWIDDSRTKKKLHVNLIS